MYRPLPQMIFAAVPTLSLSLAADQASLASLARMDGTGWACFFGLAFGVYLLANAMQIVATRRFGRSY